MQLPMFPLVFVNFQAGQRLSLFQRGSDCLWLFFFFCNAGYKTPEFQPSTRSQGTKRKQRFNLLLNTFLHLDDVIYCCTGTEILSG